MAASTTPRDPLHPGPGRPAPARRVVVGLAVLLLLAGAPAELGADWLVTRDGGRVETAGPWEVKGRLVVFTTADGQLSSLRVDDVDLEASREVTRRVEEAPEPEPAPAAESEPPPPRRRITDEDIPRGRPAPPPAAAEAGSAAGSGAVPGGDDGGAGEAPPEGRAEGPAANLVVLSSRAEDAPDGHTRVRGRLANHGSQPAVGVRLTVHLYGFEGEPLGSARADLANTALRAGEEVEFVAEFPDVFSYGAMSFDPRGTALATAAPESAPDAGEADTGDGAPAAPGGRR